MSMSVFTNCVDQGDTLGAILSLNDLDVNSMYWVETTGLFPREDTPLMYVASKGDIGVVTALIEKGTDVNICARNGWTALHTASDYGHIDIVTYLIESGADVNVVAENGYSPLHCAASSGYTEIMALLLSKGADINAVDDEYGWTALHHVADARCIKSVAFLVHLGADTQIRDLHGETAEDIAKKYGYSEIVKVIQNAYTNV